MSAGDAGLVGPVSTEPGTKVPVPAQNILAEGPPAAAEKADPAAGKSDKDLEIQRLKEALEAAGQPEGPAHADTVRMKVEPPHESVTHANCTVGSDWTDVPAWLAPTMANAAAEAGVKITQEEEEG